ncbi:hypothetical protein DFH05DRAFT_785222 [Lentinula detonsa]|uniref:Uncharacterized protein n=1 Tax=Lentinula detonsa TaxID=2804962 RepID=A0A9W8P5B8_9AGAR|nr:hypothetical protein DFH05DRAFT_785222 [Lentinula detonsa]
MSTSKSFTPYPIPTQLRSSLFKNPIDGVVPPIDELEALHAELNNLKARTMEKARRAGEDLKVLEEGMRRMKERAKKGKEREVKEKVKRERDCQFLLCFFHGLTLTVSFSNPLSLWPSHANDSIPRIQTFGIFWLYTASNEIACDHDMPVQTRHHILLARSHNVVSVTPLPDLADDLKPLLSSSGTSGSSKPRLSSHPLSNVPSSSRSSLDPEKDKKKKKKRKRDLLEESDIEMGMC